MSNEEHLIENALVLFQDIVEGKKDYDEAHGLFLTDERNKSMSEKSLIVLEKVWAMANYVTYTWCEGRDIDELTQHRHE